MSMKGKEMSKQDERIVVGKFGATYGIRGWLKVFSYTDNTESIFDYAPWFVNQKGTWVEYKVESWKRHNKGLVVKLEGLDVREDAHLLTNFEISIDPAVLPELPASTQPSPILQQYTAVSLIHTKLPWSVLYYKTQLKFPHLISC